LTLRLDRLPAAERDLEDIWWHIAEDSPAAADRLLLRILAAQERLLQFPQIGQSRPEIRADLRYWPVGNYLIFYRVDDEAITIVRVVHGARDLPELFDATADD